MTTILDRDAPATVARAAARRVPILLGLAALVVAVAVWVVAFSPALGARTVTVTGVRTLTSAQVRSAAGIGHNTPLIRLDTAAIRSRVDALADVAGAQVSVHYPSTVVINVTERVPVGYVAATNGGYVLVDKAGVQYHRVSAQPVGLPHFVVPVGSAAVASGRAVADVAAALSSSIRAQLAEIRAAGPGSITLVLRDGRTVVWGSAADSSHKAQLLPALLTQPGTRFDVSDPDVVVAR
jgi:cell division protein FtsQ